jgi:hypothetical protein
VIKRAPTTSASAITFILKLLNMLVSKAIPVSLRAPKAATTSISQERQAHRLAGLDAAEVDLAVAIRAGLATVMNSPARPQVILIPLARIESPRGRLYRRLERIHRALGLAHLTQPDQALKSVITISTMDVLHRLITSEMTAAPTGMSCR